MQEGMDVVKQMDRLQLEMNQLQLRLRDQLYQKEFEDLNLIRSKLREGMIRTEMREEGYQNQSQQNQNGKVLVVSFR